MSAISIRRAQPEDAAPLHAIYSEEAVYAETLQLPYPSIALWEQRLNTDDAHHYRLLAERAGEVLGFISLNLDAQPRRSHSASIGITVRRSAQDTGVGSALLAAAIDLAENWLRISRIELTVYADNTRALALYEKFGFETEGRARDYAFRRGVYIDAFFMARVRR
ncbi:GNAT family N-acetyltransferase [Craterilacuibacter sinensis]|uniref:GNAT family N-acetyltransferase n=1 Tax=Craterilacuibacter sinensis TaxID=2686017 RepID=A0A845BM32_9NEIS|nr:GNAT family N-acetyltransferase [Craterilacuibacter sinensis]MXR36258.1 GNAT family N-acetyltransferase [Craterilacuibacter sinensis]